MTWKSWIRAVLLFFGWGFVVHGVGLVLHEVGGHGSAAVLFGCGIGGVDLTYFGHGVLHYGTCDRWTWTTLLLADWAGLALTISAGAGAMVLQRRAGLAPLTRALVALLATAFLLGQLSYATSGGFHDLYDPMRSARALGAHGLHVLAWLPPLVLFTGAAFYGARAFIDACREHFGSRTRLHGLGQLVSTVGVAGLLYFIAFRIEWAIRTELWMRGVSYEAERLAVVRHEAPPFPIERVVIAIAVIAFVAALARPIRAPGAPREIPRRLGAIVAGAAAACFVVIFALTR